MIDSQSPPDEAASPQPVFVAALILAIAAVSVFLYWPALKLPLLYDDLLHIRIAGGLDLATVWLPTEAFGFYRPLTFFPLVIIEKILGHYPAGLLHGINIAQHALNIVLISALSWRLWHRLRWTLAAGILFAFFPFSYQAIAVYGHNVHPNTVGLILLALHAYLSAVMAGRRVLVYWLITAVLFLLSLLSHESAVLFGAFAALVQWNAQRHLPNVGLLRLKTGWASLKRQPWLIFLFAGLIYLIAYQLLPISRAPQASFDGGALWSKLLYLLQAISYPLAWFGSLSSTVPAAIIVLTAIAIVIVLTYWSARQSVFRLPLLLGWGWWGLASVVIAIPLSATYLLHGPRLLYLGSVGLALLWPVLIEPIFQLPKAGRLLWVVALAFIITTNGLFIRDRLLAYELLTSPVSEVRTVMEDRADGEGILLVNLPQWTAPQPGTYPIGTEIVAVLGDYLFVEELMAHNLGVDRPVQTVVVPDLLDDRLYNYGIHSQSSSEVVDWALLPEGGHVFIVQYDDSGPRTSYQGWINPTSVESRPLATIGPYNLIKARASQCGDLIRLTSQWQQNLEFVSQTAIPATTSIFAQFVTVDGKILGQSDGPLLGLRPDLLSFDSGTQLEDVRQLIVEEDASGTVLIGVYDFATGERYGATDTEERILPSSAFQVVVEGCS